MPADLIWYVSYGSNMFADRMMTYLRGSHADGPFGHHVGAADATAPRDVRPVWLNHPLYFAGESSRWRGGVAFLGLNPGASWSCGVAYLIADSQFRHLIAAENGVTDVPWGISLRDIPVGGWAPVPVFADNTPTRAKYNAVLRLPDIDGAPAVTLTTWRNLPLNDPGPEYVAVIERGIALSDLVAGEDVPRTVQRAVLASRDSGCQTIPPGTFHRACPLVIDLVVDRGASTEHPSVHVSASLAEINGSGSTPMIGFLDLPGGGRIRVSVLPSLGPGQRSAISEHLFLLLHRAGARTDRVRMRISLPDCGMADYSPPSAGFRGGE